MTIKVISLSKTPARLEEFRVNNPNIDFEVFCGIDGAGINKNTEVISSFFSRDLTYTNGAYGCALSHIHLWLECIEKNEPITVLEDDIILHNDFKDHRKAIIDQLPADWDICLLSWNLDSFLVTEIISPLIPELTLLNQELFIKNKILYKESNINPVPKKLLRAFGTSAYSISPRGAKKLIEKIIPITNFSVYFYGINKIIKNNGIDIAMNKFYPDINSYVSSPPISFPLNEHATSTVQENHKRN